MKIFRSLVLVVILVMVFTITASGASTSKSLSTNFTMVNLGTSTAHVTADYINQNGDPWSASIFTIFELEPNGGQAIARQYADTGLTSGRGSVVLSSDQPLASMAQILNKAPSGIPTSGAYSGVSGGSGTVYVPLVTRNNSGSSGICSSELVIQNIGTVPTVVDVNFYGSGTSSPAGWQKADVSIEPSASFYYDVDEETNLSDGWYGSVEIVSTATDISVVANRFCGAHQLQTINGFPDTQVGQSWAIPLFMSRLTGSNQSSPIAVQNISGSTIPIDGLSLSCTSATSTPASFTKTNASTVLDKNSFYFNPVADLTIVANWYGSCVVTSTGHDVVVFVQIRKPGVEDNTSAYEAFLTTGTDTRVYVPLAAKRLSSGFATSITVQNLDLVNAAVVKLTYKRSSDCTVGDAEYVIYGQTITAGGNLIQNLRLPDTIAAMPSGWFGTLLVEDDDTDPTVARPIVAYVMNSNITATTGDSNLAYDAFTLP
jgi:hypothetical protein